MSDIYAVVPLSPTSPGAGTKLPVNDLENVVAYNGANQAISITVVYNNITFVQTFTRDGAGNVTNISPWIEQP